jgi:serine/threonine protein kinase
MGSGLPFAVHVWLVMCAPSSRGSRGLLTPRVLMILTEHTAGTPAYMAPELVLQSYDEKCDIWSVGMLTYQVCRRCWSSK